MDLKQYEALKFEIADLLRSIEPTHDGSQSEVSARFTDLFTRLAEDRFNVVVVGRFNRGKTSLMNAMLGTRRLPVGVVPLTSVITTVTFGSTERAQIEFEGNRLPHQLPLEQIEEFVTERGNPGNVRGVKTARIELPAELLRRGFHFVDTPGLGSSILENTETTERFLPEADAFLLLTGFESPLSEEEFRLLARLASSGRHIYLVVNKQDLASPEERQEVLSHVADRVKELPGRDRVKTFAVSAQEALEATAAGSPSRLEASGVPELTADIVRFVVDEKQSEFLLNMLDRVAALATEIGKLNEVAAPVSALHERLGGRPEASSAGERLLVRGPTFTACEVCQALEEAVFDYLSQFQYQVTKSPPLREELADRGGLCAFHTWCYESMASPHGICIGYADILSSMGSRLGGLIAGPAPVPPDERKCLVCQEQRRVEQAKVERTAADADQGGRSPKLCLRHLRVVSARMHDRGAVDDLVLRHARSMERLAEDMRRFALKFDAKRRRDQSQEEKSAYQRALLLLAGHPSLSRVRSDDEI